eukprot:COSAG02_NODE_9822_length_2100_cov_1.800100_3_plen_157_part_00
MPLIYEQTQSIWLPLFSVLMLASTMVPNAPLFEHVALLDCSHRCLHTHRCVRSCDLSENMCVPAMPVPHLVLRPGLLTAAAPTRPIGRAWAAATHSDSYRGAAVHLVPDLQNLAAAKISSLLFMRPLCARVSPCHRAHGWSAAQHGCNLLAGCAQV